ncbi:hypothetical protein FMUND_11664 [Fusarium mundagurra]|uniref:RING-type domain-containing protein n=1 Tax=Fusarium mundagurra TaxID=1567541 RepID=A0A8H5Y619_9HYPO|nr:hypothetical protein FMUND_11664 [Fusarium mundagurra]
MKDQARKQAFVRPQTRTANTFFDSSIDHTAKMPITETFFPAFLQACDDYPHDILDIQLTCGICHEQMTFKDEDDPHLRAFVLPCMHIYCKGCVDAMAAHCKNDDGSHHACPTCRACLHCAHCRAPSEKKGHLIHMDGDKSIALIEDILKLWHNPWHCFRCDMKIYTFGLQTLVRMSKDCTEMVDNGQIQRILVRYQGEIWGEPSEHIDFRLSEQQPLPLHLEIPIKMIEKGLLKAHGIAVPNDDSTAFRYEFRLYEMRDRESEGLVWERRHIEQTERELRDFGVGNRKLMLMDLAFDLRDSWSDGNVRKKIKERLERAQESILENIEDNEDEEPEVYYI